MNKLYDIKRWLILAAVVGLVTWVGVPIQGADQLVAPRVRDQWALPELPRWKVPASVPVLVASAAFWGPQAKATVEVTTAAPVDVRWRLAGVVGAEGARRVLVVFNDPAKPQQLLKQGESLPSGHRITRIDERKVCVTIGKRAYTLALERLEQAL